MGKIKITFFFVFFFAFCHFSYGDTINIKVKINDEIITNLDIENEKRYLFF